MRDLIERQDAIEWVENILEVDKSYHPHAKSRNVPIDEVIDRLKRLPPARPGVDCQRCIFCGFPGFKQFQTVQPEIIHCKDCKNSEHWYRDRRRCFLWSEDGVSVFDDGFCNYAERRANE